MTAIPMAKSPCTHHEAYRILFHCHQPKQSFIVKKFLLVFSLPFVVLGFAGCDATNSKLTAPATSAPSSVEKVQKVDESTASNAALPDASTTAAAPTEEKVKQPEPSHITVQHCLIGFKGSVPGKPISRTKEEAKEYFEDIDKLQFEHIGLKFSIHVLPPRDSGILCPT